MPATIHEAEALRRYEELKYLTDQRLKLNEQDLALSKIPRKKIDFSKLSEILKNKNENYGLSYNEKREWIPYNYIKNSMFFLCFFYSVFMFFLWVFHSFFMFFLCFFLCIFYCFFYGFFYAFFMFFFCLQRW